MDDKVSIRIIFKSCKVTGDNVSQWFRDMIYFKPSKMRGNVLTNRKLQKYDWEKLFNGIVNELKQNDIYMISVENVENKFSFIKGAYSPNVAWLTFSLSSEILEQNKANIITYIDDLMITYDGVFTSVCSLEDEFWQNNEDIDYYHLKDKSLIGIHTKKDLSLDGNIIVDIEYNPGHSHIISGIWFGSCWAMWFGDEYYKYIPKDVLKNYRQCYENKELSNEIISIFLYENIWEYGKTSNRETQLGFRKQVGIDEVSHRIKDKSKFENNSNPSIEILTGDFQHGGVRLIKYYYDSDGNISSKSSAKESKTFEFSNDAKVVWMERIII